MQRRLHPRVRLQLPARLRWSAPLGQQTEECRTINVSRGGLLLHSPLHLGSTHPLWVTFPFDPDDAGAQPEIVARVIRCVQASGGSADSWNLAVQFTAMPVRLPRGPALAGQEALPAPNGNGHGRDVALPIRVRPKAIPWHEDAMTVEVSSDKLKFQTNREYQFGQHLMIAFAPSGEGPWNSDGESETEVVGIETASGSDFLQITVRRKNNQSGRP